MKPLFQTVFFLAMIALTSSCGGGRASERGNDGRVVVAYWEKWTGFEADAMDAVIADFNASQSRIRVERLAVSDIQRKLMLATSGGNPPDLAGIWAQNVHVYAEKGALTRLDDWLAEAGNSADRYLPAYWNLCRHRGFTWALPATPASLGLHWNKRLFREAGLDPDRPPASIAELDEWAERLTIVELDRAGRKARVRFSELTERERAEKKFTLVQLGFSPTIPGWWNACWSYWFGGDLWDGDRKITALTPENQAALEWFAGYARKYGLQNIQSFGAGLGNFASPQDGFLSGRVAMTLQGVWTYNFIRKYAPTLEWGAAPFPSADPARWPGVSIADCDMLVIPRGARHAREAFEFMNYVNQREPMEKLCRGQLKFSPLRDVSETFYATHPNPAIRVFADLAAGPGIRAAPRLTVWNEYEEELRIAYDRVFNGLADPATALAEAERRAQWKFDRVLRRWDLVRDERLKEWAP